MSDLLFPRLPGIAACCVRVRVKLGSFGVGSPWIARRGSVANQMWQALEGPPNRRGEVLRKDFNLRVRLPVPFTRADIHAGPTHEVLNSMRRRGAKGPQSVLPRIHAECWIRTSENLPSTHSSE